MLTLSKPGKLPGEGGYENVFCARTIAFDRLLQYETKTGRRFQHVIVLRPDIVTYFGHEDPVWVVRSVKDMVTMFERKFATCSCARNNANASFISDRSGCFPGFAS